MESSEEFSLAVTAPQGGSSSSALRHGDSVQKQKMPGLRDSLSLPIPVQRLCFVSGTVYTVVFETPSAYRPGSNI